jgi:hypothetical protein
MALTPTEEAQVRQLLDQQASILSLAGNEATITSKLGATKVTLSDLSAAASITGTDLLLTRQGTTDRSATGTVISTFLKTQTDLVYVKKAGDTLTGALALFGGDTGTTAALFDNTTKLATTAFVKRSGLQAANNVAYTVTSTIPATDVGKLLVVSGGGTPTFTLPAASAVPAGGRIGFLSVGAGSVIVSRGGSDAITVNSVSINTLTLVNGDTLELESNGGSGWYAVGGSAQLQYANAFKSLKAINGYQFFPSGMIIQKGLVLCTLANTPTTFNFPFTFPSADAPNVALGAISGSNGIAVAHGTVTASSVQILSATASTYVDVIAIGY